MNVYSPAPVKFVKFAAENANNKVLPVAGFTNGRTKNGRSTGQYRELSSEYNPLRKFNVVKMLNYNSKEVSLIKV